jgi:hypothetical protein
MYELSFFKKKLALAVMMLLIFFCLGNLFSEAKREAVFLFYGSKEVLGKVVDTKSEHHRKSGNTYYVTYEFTPEGSKKITNKIEVDGYEKEFIRKDQSLPILYQKHDGEIFYRPKSWEICFYHIFWQLNATCLFIVLTVFLLLTFKVKTEELQSQKYERMRKEMKWMLYIFICGFLFSMSFSTFKFFFFSSTTEGYVEEIIVKPDNHFFLKYGYKDEKKIHHHFTSMIADEETFHALQKDKNNIKINITYKKSDHEVYYIGDPSSNYWEFIFIVLLSSLFLVIFKTSRIMKRKLSKKI